MKNDKFSPLNEDLPYVMHIDLNSCFAIIEQQANRLLRFQPVAIAAYGTPRGFVLAASYEAKAKGVKLGVTVEQARVLCPTIVVLTPDPAKYREAHRLFKELLLEYSPDVVPKSIDEFVINFKSSAELKRRVSEASDTTTHPLNDSLVRTLHKQVMVELGHEIKQKIADRLGEYVTVNIGIAPNRFLAKYAAGFDKPDGMTLIDHTNLIEKYTNMRLVDLPGINIRYRARLRAHGIYCPLDFLAADLRLLQKLVFKSVVGYYWYLRLRGYEIDNAEFKQKSIGHQYALSEKTTDLDKLERLLIKLCEKTGRRLRKNNYYATGIHLYLGFERSGYGTEVSTSPSILHAKFSLGSWHHGEKATHRLYATSDIYEAAKRLLHGAEIPNRVRIMSVHVYGLEPWSPEQLNLFEIQPLSKTAVQEQSLYNESARTLSARKRVSDAVDAINNRYGEFVVTPATMIDMNGTILDRIAFGQVRDL